MLGYLDRLKKTCVIHNIAKINTIHNSVASYLYRSTIWGDFFLLLTEDFRIYPRLALNLNPTTPVLERQWFSCFATTEITWEHLKEEITHLAENTARGTGRKPRYLQPQENYC